MLTRYVTTIVFNLPVNCGYFSQVLLWILSFIVIYIMSENLTSAHRHLLFVFKFYHIRILFRDLFIYICQCFVTAILDYPFLFPSNAIRRASNCQKRQLTNGDKELRESWLGWNWYISLPFVETFWISIKHNFLLFIL